MRKESFSIARLNKAVKQCTIAAIVLFVLEGCCGELGCSCGGNYSYCPFDQAKELLAAKEPTADPANVAKITPQPVNYTAVTKPLTKAIAAYSAAGAEASNDLMLTTPLQPASVKMPVTTEAVTETINVEPVVSKVPVVILNDAPVIKSDTAPAVKKAKHGVLGIRSARTTVTAGPNLSFKSSDEKNTGGTHQPGVGFQFGVGTVLSFNNEWAVAPSLLVKQNNASEKLSYGEGMYASSTTTKYSYSYLSAPVLATYKASNNLSIFAGPEINALLGASAKTTTNTGTGQKESLNNSSVKVGVGVQAGARYAIPSSKGDSRWMIQLLYDHRISRLNKKTTETYYGGGGGYSTPAWHMSSFQLGVVCDICEFLKGH